MNFPGNISHADTIFVDGLYTRILLPTNKATPRPALFLDRDGAVVVEVHYLHKVEDVELIR